MNRSAAVLIGLLFVISLVLLRLLLPEHKAAPITPDAKNSPQDLARTQARRPSRPLPQPAAAPDEPESSTDDATSTSTAPRIRQLTGYLIDDFRSWTSLPPGYKSEGLVIKDGGVTVEAAPLPEQTRTASLLSPPLRLRPPPGGRPSSPGRELPPGSSIELEMRLSRDGSAWTEWDLIERFRSPDGPYVSSPPAPHPEELEQFRDAATTGPSIQYRMTLTAASGERLPLIRELRIWHEGPAQLEQDLSIHSPALLRD